MHQHRSLLARSVLAATAALLVLGAGAAEAARAPVYRDPPSYDGLKRAPKTKPAPLPDPVSLAPQGLGPRAVVDDAGTAHIVWAEGGADDGLADRLLYCRLKRGARACDVRHTLYAGPESPHNTDYAGPRIVRVGDQLVAFSHRYPVVVEKPDGGSSSTTWAWTSNDGGTSWSRPAIVGKHVLGDMVVIGADDDPTILNFNHDAFCGLCIQAYRSGQYSSQSGDLGVRGNDAYYAQMELERGLPVVSWVNLDGTTHVRRWTGQGSVIDPATWTAPMSLPNSDEADLAGGPSGLSLLSTRRDARRFEARPIAGTAFGAPVPVTPATDSSPIFGTLEQDAGGRLMAAWSDRNEFAKKDGLWLRVAGATPGGGSPSFEPARRLIRGVSNGQIDLVGAADGGGFAVFNHTGGVVDHGEIVAAGFGNQGPTGQPGLGAVPGGGASGTTCQKVKFGAFTADAAAGCFLHGTGDRSHLVVTGGEINLHGLRIIPEGNAKIVLDPRALRIDTIGRVRVVVSNATVGDITLWRGEIHADLSQVRPGTNLFEFPVGEFAADILGFRVGANVGVRLERDGVHIPLSLKLPAAFGGFAGEAELISTRERGLVLDSLHVHMGPLPLGPLIVNSFDIRYLASSDLWSGSGAVTLPGAGRLDADPVEFQGGDFKRARMSYTPPKPVPIGPFVYLLRIDGGFAVDPIAIEAGARIGAGAAFNGTAPVNVDGSFLMRFPPNGPADFTMKGRLSLFILQIASGYLNFQSDGYAAFGGRAGGSFGPLRINADTNGFVDATTGTYGATLNGEVGLCIDIPGWGTECANAAARSAVSSKGIAGCVGFSLPEPIGRVEGGLSFPWTAFDPLMYFNPVYAAAKVAAHIHAGCRVDEYVTPPPRPAPARVAQAGGTSFAIPSGLPTEGVKIEGDGGRPSVTVTGPGGVVVGTGQPSAAGVVFHAGPATTYIQLRRPRAGTWTVTPNQGSPAVTSVQVAHGFDPLRVQAKLAGRARRRAIEYRLSDRGHGQRAVFLERGKFGTRVIGATNQGKGKMRFAPADVRGRRRTVLVQLQRDGFVSSERRIGSFRAPPPIRPGRARRVRAVRKGNSVIVRWRPAKGAQRQVVRVRGRHGTSLARLTGRRARKARFVRVRRDQKLNVTVVGISKKLRSGPVARRKLRAARR